MIGELKPQLQVVGETPTMDVTDRLNLFLKWRALLEERKTPPKERPT